MSQPRSPNVLWENLCALAGLPKTASVDAVHAKHPSVGRGTIQRIRAGEDGTRLTSLQQIASHYGVEAGNLLLPGLGAVQNDTHRIGTSPIAVAHVMSPKRIDDEPTLSWEKLLDSALPPRFKLKLMDNAMWPFAPEGTIVEFQRADSASRSGACVLLADSSGRTYFRRYRERTPGHWLAVADNERAYEPLDSMRDGLRVLAVMRGMLVLTDGLDGP